MSATRQLQIALEVEARKFTAARVPVAVTLLFVVGVTAIATGMTLAARSGNPAVVAKLGPAAELQGWEQLISITLQVTAAASIGAFGVGLSWTIGREFVDGTVTSLFGLPVARPALAAAKLLVYLLWTVTAGLVLVALVALVGFALRLDPPSSVSVGTLLARIPLLAAFSGLVAMPAGWAATLGRGLLPGIGTAVIIMAISQILAVSGTGAWFPFAAPALWLLGIGTVSAGQLALVAAVPLLFGALTLRSWSTLQLDR